LERKDEAYLDVWLDKIKEAMKGLKYGSIQIIIHDSKIMQIDRTEKHRFQNPNSLSG
jgi:hypothetical protein